MIQSKYVLVSDFTSCFINPSVVSILFVYLYSVVIVVQSLSHVQLFATSWSAACQASLPFTISKSLLKLMSIELVMPFNHLIMSTPSRPAFNLSQH